MTEHKSPEPEVFTVRMLRETLEPIPPDMQVWIRLEGYAEGVTHIKLGSIHKQRPYLILQSEP